MDTGGSRLGAVLKRGASSTARARKTTVLAVLIAVVASLFVPSTQPAVAATGGDFNPGMIISDAAFYNPSAMSIAQIQAFLNGKVTNCTVGFTCLKDYTESTASRTASAYCSAYTGGANQTAAAMISSVAQACGINPQVLIVLLQKEQGLITSQAPSAGKYRSATGFACPDTAPCDAEFYGFFNQLYSAARQYKVYQAFPGSFGYRAGRVNTILWHPNAACGTSQVFIENQATAGLYIYTPYRPNDAALANMGGTGDACSSYGNRNFWAFYSDWFGLVAGPPPVLTSNSLLGEPRQYLLAQDPTGVMTLHPGDGSGGVLASGTVGTGWGSMGQTFSPGDFDKDGKADLLSRDGAGVLWICLLYTSDAADE